MSKENACIRQNEAKMKIVQYACYDCIKMLKVCKNIRMHPEFKRKNSYGYICNILIPNNKSLPNHIEKMWMSTYYLELNKGRMNSTL